MVVVSQIFVRDLCGRSQCLQIDVSNLTGLFLKGRIYEKTLIPPSVQRLVTGIQEITDDYVLNPDDFGFFPSINLLLRLRGGKGGFGSLLRTSKAGQKKTNNFYACRDMSGRRLRHVNAERKMEEWKAEAEDRKLEKVAEEFLKKQMKKRPGNAQAENYLEKYREESSKSIDEVRAAIKESIGNVNAKGKGKVVEEEAQPSKRVKIWVQEDENEDSDDTDDDERSVILDNRISDQSESFEQDVCGILRSVSVSPRLGRDGANGSNSSQTNDTSANASQKNVAGDISVQNIAIGNSSIAFVDSIVPKSTVAASSKQGGGILKTLEEKSSLSASSPRSISHGNVELERATAWKMDNEEDVVGGCPSSSGDGVLNFDEFQTSKDMEVLGMERLKFELQGRGLKCGGTLEQRAERLFLLKTRSVDMIPKKHIAKTK